MNTLKQDLKILGSILLLLLIFISCRTSDGLVMSNERDYLENDITELSIEEGILKLSEVEIKSPDMIDSEYELPIPGYITLSLGDNSLELYKRLLEIEYKLENIKLPVIKKKVKVSKPKIKKTTFVKKISSKINSVDSRKTTSVKKDPNSSTLNNKSKESDVKIDYILLDSKSTLLGESFTVEMDQTGWIYEQEIDGLVFKNKFYTNNKVLFEFTPTKTGEYLIEFNKYNQGTGEKTKIKVDIYNSESVSKNQSTDSSKNKIIIPEETTKRLSTKNRLEEGIKDIDNASDPDEIYFELGIIYLEEGLLKKAKEYFEYIYDNYPLSQYYEESEDKMNYIIDNFLKVR